MATYSRPGVYINELPLAAAPVDGASAATAAGAVIAAFPQGPEAVTRVTSWYDFTKRFGGYNKSYPSSFAVGSFFKNGGSELYVKRVLASNATAASVAVPSNETSSVTLLTLTAKNRGSDGNKITVKFTGSTVVSTAGYYDLSVYLEGTTEATADDVLVEQFNAVNLTDSESSDYIATVLEFFSNYIKVTGTVVTTNSAGPVLNTLLPLAGAQTSESALTYADYTGDTVYSPSVGTTTAALDITAGSNVSTTWTITVNNPFLVGDVVTLAATGITGLNTTATITEIITTNSVKTGFKFIKTGVDTGTFNAATATVTGPSHAPQTASVDDMDVLKEFEVIDKPLVFFLPDVNAKLGWSSAVPVYKSVTAWVDFNVKHFLVVDTAADKPVVQAIADAGDLETSSRVAVYYPYIYIQDPLGKSGNSIRKIGPVGAVVGNYLANDTKVGPFKTPAGIDTKIVDAIALEKALSPSDLDMLNTGITGGSYVASVNAIRNIPGAGIVIMGGRTLQQDGTANRYVSMRRSLTYIQKRLNDLGQFAVFENNTEVLWARIITVLGSFLNEYRNQGGLRGTTANEAFYIKCDAENNNAATIAAGEVHIEIGVALEYPAEFVVINLSQKTAQ
jgi:phage tail sheath protein FI